MAVTQDVPTARRDLVDHRRPHLAHVRIVDAKCRASCSSLTLRTACSCSTASFGDLCEALGVLVCGLPGSTCPKVRSKSAGGPRERHATFRMIREALSETKELHTR